MALIFKWNFLLVSMLLVSWMLLSYGAPLGPVLLGVAGAAVYTLVRRAR
jgi:hypothetical protein